MKFFGVRKYLFFLFVCFACANVSGQSEEQVVDTLFEEPLYQEELYEEEQYEYEADEDIYINLVNLNLTTQLPLETFAKNLPGTRLGLGMSYFNNFSGKDDFYWGIHYSWFRIDRLSNTFNVQEQFIEYDLFSKTKTSTIFLGYGLRYYPDIYTPKLEPFIDVKLGVNYIYTFTAETIEGSESAETTFNNADFSFAYSIGLGVQYNVRQGQAVHFIVNYNGGTSATYYINGEKGFEIPLDNFVRRTTQLDYVQCAFGLTIGF